MADMVQFVFISNYINHHQIPFCNAMYELLKGSFVFIQTEPMEEERIRMGWQSGVSLPYLKLYYEEEKVCRELIDSAGLVFFGGTDEESYIVERLQAGKPVIRYSERLYKTGQWKAVSPRGLMKKYNDHTKYRKKDVYLMCAGAYVASDFHIVRAYPNKMLTWGYFPATKQYDVDKLLSEKGYRSNGAEAPAQNTTVPHILWAARFLDWKHPELALQTAKWLKDKGFAFHMDIIGGGEEEPMVKHLYEEYQLGDVVTLQGFKTPDEVRSFMERADIYLMTSDRNEGWGAVVNEAMNSGCAVVGNHMVGAVPYLIHHGENGFIYKDSCKNDLFAFVEKLLEDEALRKSMGKKAYETITKEWNARTAAKRLAAFCVKNGFLSKESVSREVFEECRDYLGVEGLYFESGPISAAPILPEHCYKRLSAEWRVK